MDQRHTHTGTLFVSVMLLVVGLILLPVVVGMLLSYPSPVFYIGLLLAAGTFLIVRGGVQGIGKARRNSKTAAALHSRMQQQAAQQAAGDQEVPAALPDFNEHQVLAQWQIPAAEWAVFYAGEQRRRLDSIKVESLLIIVLGTFMIIAYRNGSWQMGLLVASLLAAVWAGGKYFLHLRPLKRKAGTVHLILTPSTVYINGQPNVFYDNVKQPAKFRLLEEQQPAVLEITYMWPVRRGTTFEELRVPVPAGREEEARRLVAYLSSFL